MNRGPRATPILGEAQVRAALDKMLGTRSSDAAIPGASAPTRRAASRLTRSGRCCAACSASGESRNWKSSSLKARRTSRKRLWRERASSWRRRSARAAANEDEIDRLDRAHAALARAPGPAGAHRGVGARGGGPTLPSAATACCAGNSLMSATAWPPTASLPRSVADHARCAAEAARAREHVGRLDARLGDLASLAQRARTGAERLAALDQACDAATAGAAASEAADRARAQARPPPPNRP